MTTLRRPLLLTIVIALLMAGCGGTNTSTEAASNGDAELDADAIFRFATYSRPTRLDPHRAPSAIDLVYLAPSYDRLVHNDTDGQAIPGLATEWEFSEDGRELTLTLREGVTFHDGVPFDADAAAANIDRAKTVEGSTVAAQLEVVESAEAVDDMVLQLTLNGPAASLPLVLSGRAGMMVSPEAFESNLNSTMVGTGMYELTEYRPDDVALYERNEDYWEPEAVGAAGLEIHYEVDAATRLNGVRSGQFDATSITPVQLADAEAANLVIDSGTTMTFFQIYLNKSLEPLQDKRVRQAMQHAIDREAIVESIYFGEAEAAVQPFPEGYFAYDEEVGANLFPYDPERARELLAEAGYPDGFEFEGLVPPSGQVQAEALQAMLAEVGIRMNPRAITGGEAAEIFFNNEQGDALFAIWTGRPDPSMTTAQLFTEDGFANPGDFSTERVEELHTEALSILDRDERAEALQELSGVIAEQALNTIVAHPAAIQVMTDEVVNLEMWASGKTEFRGVGLS